MGDGVAQQWNAASWRAAQFERAGACEPRGAHHARGDTCHRRAHGESRRDHVPRTPRSGASKPHAAAKPRRAAQTPRIDTLRGAAQARAPALPKPMPAYVDASAIASRARASPATERSKLVAIMRKDASAHTSEIGFEPWYAGRSSGRSGRGERSENGRAVYDSIAWQRTSSPAGGAARAQREARRSAARRSPLMRCVASAARCACACAASDRAARDGAQGHGSRSPPPHPRPPALACPLRP